MERLINQDAHNLPNPNHNLIHRALVHINSADTYRPETVYTHGEKYLHSRQTRQKVRAFSREKTRYEKVAEGTLADRITQLHLKGASKEKLDGALPEVFAAVGKALETTLGFTPYETQIKAAIALHDGKIAEMKTGEGKTLAIAHTAALNALSGEGVHVVTATNTLAKRDLSQLGAVYHKLGLTAAVILDERDSNGEKVQYIYDPTVPGDDPDYPHLRKISRKDAYQADITYGIGKAFVFDFLTDELSMDMAQKVQKKPALAIIDEVDNILVDEAQTPHIIGRENGSANTVRLKKIAAAIKKLNLQPPVYEGNGPNEQLLSGDYQFLFDTSVDMNKRVQLTDAIYKRLEEMLGVKAYHQEDVALAIQNALQAQLVYKKDIHYFVEDGKIVLIDPTTQVRTPDKRLSDGMQQALEAKEGLNIKGDNEAVNTITAQSYFTRYSRLSGTTGSAVSAARIFQEFYKLDIAVIPSRVTSRREFVRTMGVYKSKEDTIVDGENLEGKFSAIIRSALERHNNGQPVLIHASTIEDAERIKELMLPYLAQEYTPDGKFYTPQVLHAKQDKREADIIGDAGKRVDIMTNAEGPVTKKGQITIATGMAGRGADIMLGGPAPTDAQGKLLPKDSPAYQAWQKEQNIINDLGGLHLILSEMPESKRQFLQVIGRCARQDDRGSFELFVSKDDLILIHTPQENRRRLEREWGLGKDDVDSALHQIKINGVLEEIQQRNEDRLYTRLSNSYQKAAALTHTREKFRRFVEKVQTQPEEAHAKIIEAIDATMDALAQKIYQLTKDQKTDEIEPLVKSWLGENVPIDAMDIMVYGDRQEIRQTLLEQSHQAYEKRLSEIVKALGEVSSPLTAQEIRELWEKKLCLVTIPFEFQAAMQLVTERMKSFPGTLTDFYRQVAQDIAKIETRQQQHVAYNAFHAGITISLPVNQEPQEIPPILEEGTVDQIKSDSFDPDPSKQQPQHAIIMTTTPPRDTPHDKTSS